MKAIIVRDIMVPYFDFYPITGDGNAVEVSEDDALRWTKIKVAHEQMQLELEALWVKKEMGVDE